MMTKAIDLGGLYTKASGVTQAMPCLGRWSGLSVSLCSHAVGMADRMAIWLTCDLSCSRNQQDWHLGSETSRL